MRYRAAQMQPGQRMLVACGRWGRWTCRSPYSAPSAFVSTAPMSRWGPGCADCSPRSWCRTGRSCRTTGWSRSSGPAGHPTAPRRPCAATCPDCGAHSAPTRAASCSGSLATSSNCRATSSTAPCSRTNSTGGSSRSARPMPTRRVDSSSLRSAGGTGLPMPVSRTRSGPARSRCACRSVSSRRGRR